MYTADVKPNIKSTCCWIWNTDNQDKDGQHWVTFYKTRSTIFFNSYGKSIHFYDKYSYMSPFQNKQFQLLQLSTCGAWCLLFLQSSKKLSNNRQLINKFIFTKIVYLHFTNASTRIKKYNINHASNLSNVTINKIFFFYIYKSYTYYFIQKYPHSNSRIIRIFRIIIKHQIIVRFLISIIDYRSKCIDCVSYSYEIRHANFSYPLYY